MVLTPNIYLLGQKFQHSPLFFEEFKKLSNISLFSLFHLQLLSIFVMVIAYSTTFGVCWLAFERFSYDKSKFYLIIIWLSLSS